jgi:hypothetical protein
MDLFEAMADMRIQFNRDVESACPIYVLSLPVRGHYYVFGPDEDYGGPFRITRVIVNKRDEETRWYFRHSLPLVDSDHDGWQVTRIQPEDISWFLVKASKKGEEKF